jgi:hypothetical protein
MTAALMYIKKLVYDKCDFEISNLETETESLDYEAHRFLINNKKIVYRKSKITPTKSGQFVTLWNRNHQTKKIEPFFETNDFDFVVIAVEHNEKFGQFVFPKNVLIAQKIVSTKSKVGKLATRIYAPWDLTKNNQAQKTQSWQSDYFLETHAEIDVEKVKRLYNLI